MIILIIHSGIVTQGYRVLEYCIHVSFMSAFTFGILAKLKNKREMWLIMLTWKRERVVYVESNTQAESITSRTSVISAFWSSSLPPRGSRARGTTNKRGM